MRDRWLWMAALLVLLVGCESGEEQCNEAKVAAHDAWVAYGRTLHEAGIGIPRPEDASVLRARRDALDRWATRLRDGARSGDPPGIRAALSGGAPSGVDLTRPEWVAVQESLERAETAMASTDVPIATYTQAIEVLSAAVGSAVQSIDAEVDRIEGRLEALARDRNLYDLIVAAHDDRVAEARRLAAAARGSAIAFRDAVARVRERSGHGNAQVEELWRDALAASDRHWEVCHRVDP